MSANDNAMGRGSDQARVTLADVAERAGVDRSVASRVWNDINGDYIPQATELGPLSNTAFGTAITTTRYDEAILRG